MHVYDVSPSFLLQRQAAATVGHLELQLGVLQDVLQVREGDAIVVVTVEGFEGSPTERLSSVLLYDDVQIMIYIYIYRCIYQNMCMYIYIYSCTSME